MTKRTVTVHFESSGRLEPTDEECPECGFDSVAALLYLVDSVPNFAWSCGRCRIRLREEP